ncbi:hypothetical protein EJ06DRAFT_269350 [Trichodelitschia bisporula]|uniref:CUE domain-containing protein n=1 Tax=Trichodelitschia bisporula TaxID=703511 RepID=A0A6G1HIC7_9PEZI|nr:hypothetical protein EJ06DRAFT_269350 [Trichodelitschia bisporula]
MADQADKPPKGASSGAESPRTAREPDFDDEAHDTVSAPAPAERQPSPKRVTFAEDAPEPPAKPPRPMSPQAQAEATLIEAFPSIDIKVVKAVLMASGGKVEPAFNALLGMSDPDFAEEQPPPPPPRKNQPRNQLESDELYARQLAEHYQSAPGFGNAGYGDPPVRRRDTGLKPNELYDDDRDHSFFDDDLPVIKQSIQKGFQETQTKVNKWIMDFKKKLDGDEDDEPIPPSSRTFKRQNFGPSQSDQLYGIRKSAEASRRSGDRDRYDADPRVLSDDFTNLELRDEGMLSVAVKNSANYPVPPPRPPRPLANPDLFKPSGPVDEVEAALRSSGTTRQPSPATGGKAGKKWQPLTSVAPHPETEDNDPFSLGDSDEELEKKQDIKPEDSERLKSVASASGQNASSSVLKPAETTSTKNVEAEKLLSKS